MRFIQVTALEIIIKRNDINNKDQLFFFYIAKMYQSRGTHTSSWWILTAVCLQTSKRKRVAQLFLNNSYRSIAYQVILRADLDLPLLALI